MQLQEPTFYDFCTKFQEAIKNDYCISTDTDKIPQAIGNQFFATLVKISQPKHVVEEAVADVAKEPLKQDAVKSPVKKAKA